MIRSIALALQAAFWLALPLSSALAAAPRTVSLPQAIELGTKNNLELASKLTAIDQAEARQSQARAAGYPKVVGTAILSPTYSAVGDAVRSDTDLSKYGYWLQASVTILQPVYTFGRLSSFREAAGFGAEVARAQGKKDTAELTYEIKQLYYGAVLAEQLHGFLAEGKSDVDEVVKKTEEDQAKKRPAIAKRDFYRLKIFAAEADYRLEEATRLRTMAHHALSLKLGFDPTEPTLPEETTLSAIEASPPSETELAQLMRQSRPEFQQLTSGIAAKKALLSAESANLYPMLFIGGMLQFARSNVRTEQTSAFAYDPYNRDTGGVGAGAQWSWDWATTIANRAQIQAEIDQLEKLLAYASGGFRVELMNSLAELNEARARLARAKDAFQIGRKWLVSETMGQSLGLGEVKNLIDAYLARAKTAKDYWEAIYKVNMSWASLSKIVGAELPAINAASATAVSR